MPPIPAAFQGLCTICFCQVSHTSHLYYMEYMAGVLVFCPISRLYSILFSSVLFYSVVFSSVMGKSEKFRLVEISSLARSCCSFCSFPLDWQFDWQFAFAFAIVVVAFGVGAGSSSLFYRLPPAIIFNFIIEDCSKIFAPKVRRVNLLLLLWSRKQNFFLSSPTPQCRAFFLMAGCFCRVAGAISVFFCSFGISY